MALSKPWFRIHNTIVDNPKVQRLGGLALPWLNLVATANKNGGILPKISDVAFALRTSETKIETFLAEFQKRRLFDKTERGWEPHDWNDWQYASDVSTDRVKKFRERQRNVSETPSVTDQRQSRDRADSSEAKASSGGTPPKREKGARLAPHWKPSADERTYARERGLLDPEIDAEAAEYLAYFTGKDAAKPIKRDWPAAWQRWVRGNARKRISNRPRAGKPGPHGSRPGSIVDAVARLKAQADLGGPGDGIGMGRGGDGLHAAEHDRGAEDPSPFSDSEIIDADEAERMHRAFGRTEADDDMPAGAGPRPGSTAESLRAEAGGISGGCGPQGPDDTIEHFEVVADLGRNQGAVGSIHAAPAAIAASDDGMDIPGFLKRKLA